MSDHMARVEKVADESFAGIGTRVGELVAQKNAAYGDSIRMAAKCMQLIFPNGIPVEKIPDALMIVRILDKLNRIANHKEAFNESPYTDITGYGILGIELDERGL